jgi:hypothetical protein
MEDNSRVFLENSGENLQELETYMYKSSSNLLGNIRNFFSVFGCCVLRWIWCFTLVHSTNGHMTGNIALLRVTSQTFSPECTTPALKKIWHAQNKIHCLWCYSECISTPDELEKPWCPATVRSSSGVDIHVLRVTSQTSYSAWVHNTSTEKNNAFIVNSSIKQTKKNTNTENYLHEFKTAQISQHY